MTRWAALSLLLLAMTAGFSAAAQQARTVKIYVHSGTGFFVSADGYLLTNEHVVKDCRRITISGAVPSQDVTLVAADKTHDLALLKANTRVSLPASLRSTAQPISKGERIAIVGYPGEAAKTGRTVTREATVFSTDGPRGEEEWMQIGDIAQQGNSGGPLFDTSGNVIGVVAAKVQVYTYYLHAPEEGTRHNASVAVSLATVRDFLRKHGVRYRELGTGVALSTNQITAHAHRFVVNVQCQYKTEVR